MTARCPCKISTLLQKSLTGVGLNTLGKEQTVELCFENMG
jgi:hypothetical protein